MSISAGACCGMGYGASMDGLRAYQSEMVARVLPALDSARAIAVLPTGAGKTHVAVAVMMDAVERGERVLAVAHRNELLEQMVDRLVSAGLPAEAIGRSVVVRSIQKIGRSGVDGPFGLLVIDEAHHAAANTYRDLLDAHPSARVLGLTATPSRLDGKPLDDVFGEIIEGPPVESLIGGGFLARPRYFAPAGADAARSLVEGVKSTAGDYDKGEIAKRVNRSTLIGDIVSHWTEHAAGLRTIVFAASVSHAESIARRFVKAGVAARVVTGNTPVKERAAALTSFRAGDLTVLVNCELFGEGLDVPEVRCVVLARPTQSLTVYRQQCGRAMRPGEIAPIVLDHAGCVWTHGLPTWPVAWTLEGRVKREPGGALVRRCAHCGAVLDSFICDDCGECGRRVGAAERMDPEEAEWERLVEVAAGNGISADALRLRLASGMGPDAATTVPLRGSSWDQWGEVATEYGVSRKAFLYRIRNGMSMEDAATTSGRGLRQSQDTCAGWDGPCGKVPSKSAFAPSVVAQRRGEPWRCGSCAAKKAAASMDPIRRAERIQSMNQAIDKQAQKERARRLASRPKLAERRNASMTPQERSEAARKAWATRRAKAAATAPHTTE